MTLVVLAVRHDGAASFTERAQAAIRSVGGKIGLYGQPQMNSYFLIGRKGMLPGQAIEKSSPGPLTYPASAEVAENPTTPPRRPEDAARDAAARQRWEEFMKRMERFRQVRPGRGPRGG